MNQDKIILDLCGGTGSWSKPYMDAGYDVRIITEPDFDVFAYKPPKNVYGILAAPPCTMFSNARTNAKKPRDLKEGMDVVAECLNIIWTCQYELSCSTTRKTSLKFWALENPKGMLKFFLGNPPFEFNPYDFGDDYKKKTHLWGYFNAPVKAPIKCTKEKFDRTLMKDFVGVIPEGYTVPKDSNRRQVIRGITPKGFANAFFKENR